MDIAYTNYTVTLSNNETIQKKEPMICSPGNVTKGGGKTVI